MSFPLPPLLVARMPRSPGGVWDEAASWFGGRPRLGSLSWPRDPKTGEPMVFVAQIDLAEVAPHAPDFPSQGALAFFLGARGSCDGAVLHVPPQGSKRPTDPPSDTLPVRELGSWPFPDDPGPGTELLFPYWPLTITALGVRTPGPDDADFSMQAVDQAVGSAIDVLYERREFFMSSKVAFETLADAERPHWWHSAIFFAGCMQNALHHAPRILKARAPWLTKARAHYAALTAKSKPILGVFGRRSTPSLPELDQARKTLERLEAQDAAYHRDLPGFEALVSECVDFAADRRSAAPMTADDWSTLAVLFQHAYAEFKDFARYAVPNDLHEIETQTILYLLTADEAAYKLLPEPVRTYINRTCLMPTRDYWHQMFGIGVDIQGAAVWDNADRHLLLQLVYDDMMHWRFGDMGAYQFWISPEDVKARNWAGARLTFEGH